MSHANPLPARARSSVSSSRGRIEFIDAVRGVASLVVAAEHCLEVAMPAYGRWSISHVNFGRVGIVAFFVVSGYVVGLTLSKQSIHTFSVRRFWRLYPAYWVATLLYVATVALTGQQQPEYTAFVILINVTMLQGFIGTTTILGVAWTLGIEVAFYAQSVVSKFARLLEKGVWLGVGWLAVFGAMAVADWKFDRSFTAVMPLMMFSASLGFAIFLWDSKRNAAVFPMLFLAIVVAPAFGMILGQRQGEVDGIWPAAGFNASYLGGLGLFGAFYAFRAAKMPAWVLWLGAISYALYLVHTIVLAALHSVEGGAPPEVFLPLALALSVLAAWVLHRAVERPSIIYGRRLTSR